MSQHPHHTLAARFDTAEQAAGAAHDLAARPQVHVVVHHAGSRDTNEAEVDVLATMEQGMMIAIPVAILAMMGIVAAAVTDLPTGALVAVGIGPGILLGFLLGGMAGILLRQRRLDDAHHAQAAHLHDDGEVVVATVERRALLDPNHRYDTIAPTRDDAVIVLEHEIQDVFVEHHGRPLTSAT